MKLIVHTEPIGDAYGERDMRVGLVVDSCRVSAVYKQYGGVQFMFTPKLSTL